MAAFLNDLVLDNGLSYLTSNGTKVYICSALPTTYTQAASTYALGNKTSITVGSPANASPSGRKVAVSAITGGSVTSTGTATHWALTTASALLAAAPLSASTAVTSGNTFTLDSIEVKFPDP